MRHGSIEKCNSEGAVPSAGRVPAFLERVNRGQPLHEPLCVTKIVSLTTL